MKQAPRSVRPFVAWLRETHSSELMVQHCTGAALLAMKVCKKALLQLSPEEDLPEVLKQVEKSQSYSRGEQTHHRWGLVKLIQFLRWYNNIPAPPHTVNWTRFVGSLSVTMQQQLRDYIAHQARNWQPDTLTRRTRSTLNHITASLRWMQAHAQVNDASAVTPKAWFAYLDHRLSQGLSHATLNCELAQLKGWLYWLRDNDVEVNERMLTLQGLSQPQRLPRDVPVQDLHKLLDAMRALAASKNPAQARMGRMDLAWALLMLQCGLRKSEVDHLKLKHLNWENGTVFVEQSKHFKDRVVPMSAAVQHALQQYLDVRGAAKYLPEEVFVVRQARFNDSYIGQRLRLYYAERTGCRITAHQLRHSCATMLLNAGMSLEGVQYVLGHKRIDTTLGYARLYSHTISTEYTNAMARIEERLDARQGKAKAPVTVTELLVLAQSINGQPLVKRDQTTLKLLCEGLSELAIQLEGS